MYDIHEIQKVSQTHKDTINYLFKIGVFKAENNWALS